MDSLAEYRQKKLGYMNALKANLVKIILACLRNVSKEDNISELEKLIRDLYFKLSGIRDFRTTPSKRWENAVATVDIERDRYKISKYRYERKGSFADEFPSIALEWHPTKNGTLTPQMFKGGSTYAVWWKCSVCGCEWKTSINHRVNGTGCKQCSISANSGAGNYKARTIYQYTLDGVFVKEWSCISEAARALNASNSNLCMCADGKRCKASGYKWSYEYYENLPELPKKNKSRKGINGKSIDQLDLQGNVVNHFSSLNEAEEKTGINATSISKVINGHIKTAGGFYWEKHLVDKGDPYEHTK